ncbi:Crp/Fnr family transcriptional regulator [Acetilactobacillus jinshanensis]|uniref:Crp/Fnr family transcriptional regulator n=1 Tax=Acetilactobacillus jinshanensis TaxID=1720083 RepID=A0A4P6ZKN3_9LACO|nr:Crp/Fnr family transcriptional regulator [Acetilactobacillus jinshanensis]QBP18218.1 Crp/Fnr family transcriptional regulator [Acetilactobacillus jinshanensis]URL61088.1 Crp/Fnr family transcriptional regulator [uncultured bacterium]
MHFSIDALRNYQLFKNLPLNLLKQFSQLSVRKCFYPTGSLIYDPNKINPDVYLMKSGLIKIYGLNHEGKSHTIYFVTKGMLTSQSGLFHKVPNYYYSTALKNSWGYSINYGDFKALLSKSLKFTQNVLTHIDKILISLENMNLGQNIDNSKELVYHYLASKSKLLGNPFKLPITNKEIANYLGIRPETFSRQLHQLSQDNDIQIHHKIIKII